MSIVTTGNHPKAHWPGVYAWFGHSYRKKPLIHMTYYQVANSNKNYEEMVELTGIGLAPKKTQAGSVTYGSSNQGYINRFYHTVYAIGEIVSREAIEDNQYAEVALGKAENCAFSMRQTKEVVGHILLNEAFSTTYGDGKALCASDHPTVDGTQSNILATAADLSEDSLEDALIIVGKAEDSQGFNINLTAQRLIVAEENKFNAGRILKSDLQNDTANNAINIVKAMGLVPEMVHSPYLTDSDAWFIQTDAPRGLTFYQRRKLEFTRDNDFDTENAKMKATERYVHGFGDWRCLVGSAGA